VGQLARAPDPVATRVDERHSGDEHRLQALTDLARQGLAAALAASAALQGRGLLVPAIRYPTVPRGSARLRITLSAAHHPEDIDMLKIALAEIVPDLYDSIS